MTKKSAKKNGKASVGKPAESVTIAIRHELPSDLPTHFCNHFVVQQSESTIRMMFFDIQPPLILSDGAARKEELKKIPFVVAKCVSRIVMSVDQMPAVINALTSNLQKLTAKTDSVGSSARALTAIRDNR